MSAGKSCCRVCSRGLYSCHWRVSQNEKQKCGCCWLLLVSLVSLLSLCWMYICLITFNDREDLNWKGFMRLKRWVNWFMVLVTVYAVFSCYCILLLVFALCQVVLGEKLDLHWLHKILLFVGLILIVFGITAISLLWKQEWAIVSLSFQATGPFLQFGAVGALTLLSWFVFHSFHRAKKVTSKWLTAVVFVAMSAAIFTCPHFIHSPCLILEGELPEKPKLFGHRGAPMLAPENTMMSFDRSIGCGVTAFETDVQVSKNGTAFLMHDSGSEFLLRTTNVKEIFPHKVFNRSEDVTWEELQRLNAGGWFVETDPFCSVSRLSEEDQETAGNQTIPSLLQLLNLAQEHNISVIFDLYSPNQKNDTEVVVRTILQSGIDPSLILWLPPAERKHVNLTAPGFVQFYGNERDMENNGGKHLNVQYSKLSTQEIRDLRSRNVTVNLWVVNERWLFSLLWCAGASSVTTNACHTLNHMGRPDWVMEPRHYQIIWISVDVVSVLTMIGLYILQRKPHCHRKGKEKKRKNSAWTERLLTHSSV